MNPNMVDIIKILCNTGLSVYRLYLADKNPKMQDFFRDVISDTRVDHLLLNE